VKIVYNNCYGGYGLSKAFKSKYPEYNNGASRTDPDFIAALEAFGLKEASANYAALEIANVPDNATDYTITEYDGAESILYVVDGKIRYYEDF